MKISAGQVLGLIVITYGLFKNVEDAIIIGLIVLAFFSC